ncbi:MAG: acyl-CoA dehydrogenase family protein [Candidatus Micrarchaeia archaeon]|jgi:alkylation response protein AidB-like acyl-CoA dehydrogenase
MASVTLANFGKPQGGPLSSEYILKKSGAFRKLTEEQMLISDSLRDFSLRSLSPRTVMFHNGDAKFLGQKGHAPSKVIQPEDIIDLTQFRRIGVDEKLGGDGLGIMEQCLMHYWLAYYSPSAAAVLDGISLGLMPLKLAGTEEQKLKVIPKIMDGTWTICFALTGTECGSDPFAQDTAKFRYDPEKNLYLLDGEKIFITGAPNSNITTTFAKGEDGKTTAFLVNRKEDGMPGFTTGPPMDKVSWRASDTSWVKFASVPVQPENIIGKVGQGGLLANLTLFFGRLKIAWEAYAIMAAILDATTHYARLRNAAGGGKLADSATFHSQLGGIVPKIMAVRALLFDTASLAEIRTADDKVPEEFGDNATSAKIFACSTLQEVADWGARWNGGAGVMNDSRMAVYDADRKVYLFVEGAEDILKVFMGRRFAKE